jgi:hypothetical protein
MPIDVNDVFSVMQHNGEILYSVDVADGQELLLRFGDLQRRTRDIGRLLALLSDFHDSDWFQGDEDDDELRVIVFAHIGIIRRLIPDTTSGKTPAPARSVANEVLKLALLFRRRVLRRGRSRYFSPGVAITGPGSGYSGYSGYSGQRDPGARGSERT